MMQNGRKVDRASRWILYHGTSTKRLKGILKEDRLRISDPGDPKVSLTTELSVAEFWACHAVFGEGRGLRNALPDQQNCGVVLVLDGEKLLARGYDLTEFRDDIWGEGECDWENEIACWEDIERFREFLIAIEPIAATCYREVLENGSAALSRPLRRSPVSS